MQADDAQAVLLTVLPRRAGEDHRAEGGDGTVPVSRGEARQFGLDIALLVAAAATAWLGTTWL